MTAHGERRVIELAAQANRLFVERRALIESAMQALDLIEASADGLSYLESCEAIDRRRVAIREAAIRARQDLEVGLRPACGRRHSADRADETERP